MCREFSSVKTWTEISSYLEKSSHYSVVYYFRTIVMWIFSSDSSTKRIEHSEYFSFAIGIHFLNWKLVIWSIHYQIRRTLATSCVYFVMLFVDNVTQYEHRSQVQQQHYFNLECVYSSPCKVENIKNLIERGDKHERTWNEVNWNEKRNCWTDCILHFFQKYVLLLLWCAFCGFTKPMQVKQSRKV